MPPDRGSKAGRSSQTAGKSNFPVINFPAICNGLGLVRYLGSTKLNCGRPPTSRREGTQSKPGPLVLTNMRVGPGVLPARNNTRWKNARTYTHVCQYKGSRLALCTFPPASGKVHKASLDPLY